MASAPKLSNEWMNKWMNQWWWHCQVAPPVTTSAKITGGDLHRWWPPPLGAVSIGDPKPCTCSAPGQRSGAYSSQGATILIGVPCRDRWPLSNTYPHFSRKYALSMKVQDCPSHFDFLQSIRVWHRVQKQADVAPIIILYTSCGWKRGHILDLTSSGEAHMMGPTNYETESNHIEWCKHKNS